MNWQTGRQLRRPTAFAQAQDEVLLFAPANLRSAGKPFNRNLIANGQKYAPVLIDLFIEFVALVAHGNPLEPDATSWVCLIVNAANGNLFTGLPH